MRYFDNFASNTLAGCANQKYFRSDNSERVGRVYTKIFAAGEYAYSLLYSNIIDSTFSDGSESHANYVCDEWEIISIKAAVTGSCDPNEECTFVPLTFNGKPSKTVAPGEFFSTDPCKFDIHDGEYLCVELCYKGRELPYHPESQIAVYTYDGEWKKDVFCPVPAMIGCDRKVKKRIGFLGDSITQGIGATFNSYRHYAAEAVGSEYAYWNLGIGFARAEDAASDGAWLYKAKQNDIVCVCLGVNDIQQGKGNFLSENLKKIRSSLEKANVKVIFQTVPPFDYIGERLTQWQKTNAALNADFDNVTILGDPKNPQKAIYGGHPGDEGCEVWGKMLGEFLRENVGNE